MGQGMAVQAIQMEHRSTMLKLGVMGYALLTQMEESSHALCVYHVTFIKTL